MQGSILLMAFPVISPWQVKVFWNITRDTQQGWNFMDCWVCRQPQTRNENWPLDQQGTPLTTGNFTKLQFNSSTSVLLPRDIKVAPITTPTTTKARALAEPPFSGGPTNLPIWSLGTWAASWPWERDHTEPGRCPAHAVRAPSLARR